MKSFAGIEVVDTRLQIVIGDDRANILQRYTAGINRNAGAEAMCAQITTLFNEIDTEIIRGIGIGFGGPVDHKTGKIWTSYDMEGWSNFPLRNWLSDLTGVFVSVENDANVAAFGEALFGAGRNYDNVFYVTIASGIGAGHVVGKEIYHGNRPGETELGHVRLDKTCRTVQACCSITAIETKIQSAVSTQRGSFLAKSLNRSKDQPIVSLMNGVSRNDELSLQIFFEVADDIAFAISHAVHLLHPETIVIGGNVDFVNEALRSAVEDKIKIYIMEAFHPGPDIQLSALRNDAVTVGALALAIAHKE
ncbi:MAG TPA: ROK family protein [Chryseosolibacter sp.]|nr:ROK family protein [Chryseosolibacter sp.]